MTQLLDASALLALINEEPGMDIVTSALDDAAISAVNVAEVSGMLSEKSWAQSDISDLWRDLDIATLPLELEAALLTGALRPQTSDIGLSLADRACIATAILHEYDVLTADRQWALVEVDDLKITQIR